MKVLAVYYDVTDLTDAEIDQVAFEAEVQAEVSDGHPSVDVRAQTISDGVLARAAWEGAERA